MEPIKTYTYDEAFEASLKYFAGDELAARVWVNKYAMKDSFGNIFEQSPDQMHWRIANEVARIEKKYKNPMSAEQVFELLDHFRYIIPAGSPMTGIGNNQQVASLSNCFVIGLDGNADSYGAILRVDEEQVQLMKRRGGEKCQCGHRRVRLIGGQAQAPAAVRAAGGLLAPAAHLAQLYGRLQPYYVRQRLALSKYSFIYSHD